MSGAALCSDWQWLSCGNCNVGERNCRNMGVRAFARKITALIMPLKKYIAVKTICNKMKIGRFEGNPLAHSAYLSEAINSFNR